MIQPNNITLTDICQIFHVNSIKGESTQINNRPNYGLSFCQSGRITYDLNGQFTISDQNCAVFLPQHQTYTVIRDESGIFPVINFLSADFICDRVIAIPLQNSNLYLKEFEKMKALSLYKENRAEIISIFYHILHQLSEENTARNILLPAIHYLSEHYADPLLSNTELAAQCNISEVYFRKIFAETYHTTPRQYLIDIRLNRAKQLLAEGILKISAVAEQCGFTNQYHFCRIFKEKTDVTPSEYRKCMCKF